MKRCPTCNKTFTDENLSFCIDDGTPLVDVEAAPYDSEATLVSPSPSAGSDPTQAYDQHSAPSDWKGPAYQPPGSLVQPAKKRRAWPWLLAIAALVSILVGAGVAAVIIVPKMIREARNQNTSTNSNPNNTNSNSNSNSGNSNSSVSNTNQNSNTNNTGNEGNPPTDQEQVLQDLRDVEDEWQVANINADKKKLEWILADDYVGTDSNGKMQGKADYIRDIKPDSSIKHWDFENLKLELKGDRATLSGNVTLQIEGQDKDLVLNFTDRFVWRNARWQAVGSEVSRVK